MTILIAGDSYSTLEDFRSYIKANSWVTEWSPHYSWTEQLGKYYPVKCVGKQRASNWDILQQLRDNLDYEFALVNLTSWFRVSHRVPQHQVDALRADANQFNQVREQSKRLASEIVKQPRCYVWSPFAVYESWTEVDTIFLRDWDEQWNEQCIPKVTGCHLTREGNDWMLNHMTSIIEESR
jgi:hypothetical protein